MNIGAFGENFPYTNYHDLNLDWIIKTIKDLLQRIDEVATTKIKIADPLEWNITSNYDAFTITEYQDKIFLSLQSVPPGINISNEEYWTEVFDIDGIFTNLKRAITFSDDGIYDHASETRYANQLVWLNDILYKVTTTINQGEQYIPNVNITAISIEKWVRDYITSVINRISGVEDDIDEINTELENHESELDRLSELLTPDRKILIIGDSYGMRNTPNYLSVLTGLMPNNIKGLATSGYGFTNGDFYAEFDTLIASLPSTFSPQAVTDIVFAGGWNDAREIWAERQTRSSLTTRIGETLSHAHTVCPNARIYTCFMAWHSDNSVQNQVSLDTLLQTRLAYEDITKAYAGSLVDVQYVMRNGALLDDSLFHPNVNAAYPLARALLLNLTSGSSVYNEMQTLVPAYLANPGVTGSDFRIFIAFNNGHTKIKSVPFQVQGTMTSNVMCKFLPQYSPVIMPDNTRSLYLNAYFKGTAGNKTFDYTYANLVLYDTGEMKLFPNGEVLSNVNGNVIIDTVIDNSQIL